MAGAEQVLMVGRSQFAVMALRDWGLPRAATRSSWTIPVSFTSNWIVPSW